MLAPLFAPDEPLSGNYASHPGQRGGESFAFPEDGLLARLDGDGFVQFHQPLAQRVGYKAALFLGHAIYWHRYVTRNAPRRHGWFYMTAARCEQATGLSAHEQRIARHLLASEDVLEEVLAGQPARLHYRVKLDHLIRWSGLEPVDGFTRQVTWQAFSSWLNTPINFYRALQDACGFVAGGIYLSYLLRRQRNAMLRGEATLDGFFAVTHSEVRRTLGMSEKTQRNTRLKLRQAGLLIERGNNAVHVDLQAVLDALNGVPACERKQIANAPQAVTRAVRWLASDPAHPALARSNAPVAHGQQQQLFSRWLDQSPEGQQICRSVSRMFASSPADYIATDDAATHSAKPVIHSDGADPGTGRCQRPALFEKLTRPFLKTDLPFLPNIKRHKKKQEKTTTSPARDASPAPFLVQPECRRREFEDSSQSTATQSVVVAIQPEAASGGQHFVMPKALDAVWHESVLAQLHTAPAELRQALLDELEGQLGIEGKTIYNPPGWLRGLIAAYQRGGLQLAMANKVAADRKHRAQMAAAVKRAQAALPPPSPSRPEASEPQQPSAAALAAREQLKVLRARMTGSAGK